MSDNKIHNLSEYFAKIEELNLQDYISRGECRKYPRIQASAFRPFEKTGKYYTKEHQREFYNYIGNSLTEMQRKHFLAYSQHSGLPTNLIDFTTSPLVSLFFACYGENAAEGTSGYVYFIRKERLLPVDLEMESGYNGELLKGIDESGNYVIDKWINKFYTNNDDCVNYNDPEFIEEYIKMLLSFLAFVKEQQSDYTQTEMYTELVEFCVKFEAEAAWTVEHCNSYERFESLNELLYIKLQKLMEILEAGNIIEDVVRTDGILHEYHYPDILYNRFVAKGDDAWADRLVTESGEYNAISDRELLHILLDCCMEFAMYSTKQNYYLPVYATYSPPNISGRVSMQNSVFICQTYYEAMRSRNELVPKPILVTQQIVPDVVLEICDKEKMLAQLDMVGINLKTIYGDHDNIAQYIKSKLF